MKKVITGAAYPCNVCGASHNNSIHKNKTQFNYHEYVPEPEKEREPTLEERLAALETRVAALEQASPDVLLPEECRKRECSYYRHYLAYGPAELTHEGFHAAEKECEKVQKRALEWMENKANDGKPFPDSLDRLCRSWEARVRA